MTNWHIPDDPILILDPQGGMQISTAVDEYSRRASAFYALSRYPLGRNGMNPSDIVNVTPAGMPWQMWTDVTALLEGEAWSAYRGVGLNVRASLLPTQYGAKVPVLYGPIVITGPDAGNTPCSNAWTYLTGLIDDIERAVSGEPIEAPARAADRSWSAALVLLSHVLRSADRPGIPPSRWATLDELDKVCADAVLLTEERVEHALTRGLESQ